MKYECGACGNPNEPDMPLYTNDTKQGVGHEVYLCSMCAKHAELNGYKKKGENE
jgi:hypothetical protein